MLVKMLVEARRATHKHTTSRTQAQEEQLLNSTHTQALTHKQQPNLSMSVLVVILSFQVSSLVVHSSFERCTPRRTFTLFPSFCSAFRSASSPFPFPSCRSLVLCACILSNTQTRDSHSRRRGNLARFRHRFHIHTMTHTPPLDPEPIDLTVAAAAALAAHHLVCEHLCVNTDRVPM